MTKTGAEMDILRWVMQVLLLMQKCRTVKKIRADLVWNDTFQCRKSDKHAKKESFDKEFGQKTPKTKQK